MESAGSLSAREIMQIFSSDLSKGSISIICGPGHNGGDGLVVARHLFSAGYIHLRVFLWEGKSSDLFKKQLDRVKKQGIQVIFLLEKSQLKDSTLIVDALFGTGSRGCRGELGQWLNFINSLRTTVVSLDVPSGLDCDRGVVEEGAIQATRTLTFGLAKPGFFIADGPAHVGQLQVLPIGFPRKVIKEVACTHFLFDRKLAFSYLPLRQDQSHKARHGRLLVCAGGEGCWGAGVLASSSAYRMGVGYVVWASATDPYPQIVEIPEVMTSTVDRALGSQVDAVAFGCGLGVNEKTAMWIERLKKEGYKKVVLDADGITTAVKFNLMPLCESWVITPHEGELARVIGWKAGEIEKDRLGAAFEGARQSGCHVLLKGYRSVFIYKGKVTIINSGNSALATAGTGDVLTGMIGALLAQNLKPEEAVPTAAYFHGLVADEWVASGRHRNSFSASDIKESLPSFLGQ